METIVYLIRHSEKFDINYMSNRYYDFENYKITREKRILSTNGEKKAMILSENKEFDNIDVIYTSNYVRAIQTAKYLAERLKLKINVDPRLNEKVYGNPLCSKDIYLEQIYDENLKNPDGESRKEVTERMYSAFGDIVNLNKGKNIAIYSHGAAITFLLMKWCKLDSIDKDRKKCFIFNNKIVINKVFGTPEVFKIYLDDELNVKDIVNIEIKY